MGGFFAGLTAQTCKPDEEDPFTSVCSPSKGPAAGNGRSAESYSSSQVVWLTEVKDAALKLSPAVKASDFQQTASDTVSFKVHI